MAVYTHLGAEDLAWLIAQYDVGELVSPKGIAEGVSNSNWLVETTGQDGGGARFILTLYERRIDYADLPYFLDLLDHLAAKGCPVPRTMHDRTGASWRMVEDPGSPSGASKAAALIEFLPGVSPTRPTPAQARSVGVRAFRRTEAWRDRLLREGELALADFLAECPGADPRVLARLLAEARSEAAANAPPRARRQLFRALHKAQQGP